MPTTVTVKKDGSGDATTIQAGLNLASTGDTVEIQDSGTYYEGEIKAVSPVKSNITLKAAAGQTPIIDGFIDGSPNRTVAIEFYTGWVIEGLTIRNFTGTGKNAAGLVGNGNNRTVTIDNCTIHSCTGDAIARAKDPSTIKNCTIYNITDGGMGIDVGTQRNITIKNCLLYDISGTGIQATNTGVVVEHCTLYNTSFNPSVSGYGIIATLGAVKYCIVVNPVRIDGSHKVLVAGVRSNTTSYNCVSGSEFSSGNGSNYYNGAGTGDITSDPLLSSSSFKVSLGSPTIAAAVGSTRIGNVDREGTFVTWQLDNLDVIGVDAAATPNDMGAFEFKPTSVCGVKTENIAKVLGATA